MSDKWQQWARLKSELEPGSRGTHTAPQTPGATPMPNVIDCAHYTVDGLEQDKLGFFVPTCACGWKAPPVPDEETAMDFLMQHAYEAGILTERHRLTLRDGRDSQP